MAGTRSGLFPRITGALLILVASLGTAVAAADELPSSTSDIYRVSTSSTTLAGNGYSGAGVTVAVIDTGVANVPGLHGRVVHQQNISAAPADGDQYGHGTFVAGLVHEVAPAADIISIKLSGADGSVDVTQVLAALQWISINRQRYGIDVVNLSFGNDSKQSAYTSLLNFGVQKLWDQGIVVVASAGNLGSASGTVTKPADDPLIISVGASDERGTSVRDDDIVANYASRGPTQDGLAKPDLVAPGSRIVSLRAPGSTADVQAPNARIGDEHFRGSGTSFAAPIVSGVVAQMLSADPSLSPNQVKYGLLKGAQSIAGDAAALGAGTVRAGRALHFAKMGSANANVPRGNGRGSLEADRGSAVVDVETYVQSDEDVPQKVKVRLKGSHTAETVPTPLLAPEVEDGSTIDATDGFNTENYLDPSSWEASQWGASQWGASQWGASQWGASQWGASQWGASQWGSSQWWASQWG